MSTTIQAKVATIIDSHTAAINAGAKKGVAVGDIARVVRRTKVFDPDTKLSLGEVTTPIVNLRVTSVAPEFCLANTFEPADSSLEGSIAALIGRGYSQGDPVQQISEVGGSANVIAVRVGSEVDIERPTPAKAPVPPPVPRRVVKGSADA